MLTLFLICSHCQKLSLVADSPKHVAQKLLEHPHGIEPKTFDFPTIIQKCHDFRELVGKAGDLYIIHPYMLHASSANHSGRPRVMSNPPVILKEPLRLDQNRSDLSLGGNHAAISRH